MPLTTRERFLREYTEALTDDGGVIFLGAGVSMAAGYPSWSTLLKEIGEELGLDASDVADLAALAQWSVRQTGSYNRVRRVVREHIGVDHPIPDAVRTIARLPLRHLWTTNYDRLVERAFEEIKRPLDVVPNAATLSLRPRSGAARLYKMHGSVEAPDDLVISTDDYELYRSKRGAYLPLLQAHLTSMSLLFVGLSFTDPNVRHVLSLIRESFADAPPEHFALVRPPHREDFRSQAEYDARSTQHKLWADDLTRYGLVAVEIEDYAEVPDLLRQVERRVAARRVWISGSWPSSHDGTDVPYELAERLGFAIGQRGLALVTGAGLTVGSGSLSGFLRALREAGGWDIEQRLIARPFPQPLVGEEKDHQLWTALRRELARLSGLVIIIGGTKLSDGRLVVADGVLEEAAVAQEAGVFLLPIGASGGAAEEISERLVGSELRAVGSEPQRPSDEELRNLSKKGATAGELTELVLRIIDRIC